MGRIRGVRRSLRVQARPGHNNKTSPKPVVRYRGILAVRLRCLRMGLRRSLARPLMMWVGRIRGVRRSLRVLARPGRSNRPSPKPVVRHTISLAFRLRCRRMGIRQSLARTREVRRSSHALVPRGRSSRQSPKPVVLTQTISLAVRLRCLRMGIRQSLARPLMMFPIRIRGVPRCLCWG